LPASKLQGAGKKAVVTVEPLEYLLEQLAKQRKLVIGPALHPPKDRESSRIR
jgi:hypothetical protein